MIGTIHSLWRYPVKSMRGERLDEAFLGFAGVYGDRLFAIGSSAALKAFPYLTARDRPEMLLCTPRFRAPERAVAPVNLAEAEKLGPGVTPLYAEPAELMVDVETPSGETFAIDDPRLLEWLGEGLPAETKLRLLRSERALTDCRPISIFSVQSAGQLSEEVGAEVDPRCFRANVYLDLTSMGGYGEQRLIGRKLRLGSKAIVAVLERDPRCKLITLDPETGKSDPRVLREVAQRHDATAGVYAAVLVEGTVRKGDAVEIAD